MLQIAHRTLVLIALVTLGSCSCATPGAQPSDMTTAGHAEAAEEHGAEAAEHAKKYDKDATATRRVLSGGGAELVCLDAPIGVGASARCYGYEQYNPTAHHLASAERHEKMSRDHAAAGVALATYEEGACKLFEPKVRSSCPLLGQLERVDRLPKGVRLTPKAGVNVDAWQAHIACHVAFAQAQGASDMPVCPLGVTGVRAEAAGNVVELTSEDAITAAKLLTLAQLHAE